MQKKTIWPVPVALVLGIMGFLLRILHFNTGYDEKGLPVSGFFTLSLTIFAAAVTLLFLITALSLGRRFNGISDFSSAFAPDRYRGTYSALTGVSAVLSLAGCAMFYAGSSAAFTPVLKVLFIVLAALTFLTMVFYALYAKSGSFPRFLGYMGIAPALLWCFFLVYQYIANASNPTVTEYSFECIAFAAGALFFLSAAGYIFCKRQPKATLFSGLMSTTFSIAAAATPGTSAAYYLIFGSLFIFAAVSTLGFTAYHPPND